ncbi:MAG: lipid-binding SYLF domain-containing protein [Cyanobacteria bacterium J06633_2]
MSAFQRAIAICTGIVLATATILGTATITWAGTEEEREDAIEELNRSQEIFQEIAANPDTQIPTEVMRESKAVIIITNVGQGGFIFGGRRGDGLMVLREANSTWSNPAFMTLGGGSFGLQFGGRSSDLVMLVMTQEAIDDILDGDVELGGNVTGTAGPVGATVADPAAANGDILIYSRSSGLFGGATAGATSIEFDDERNEAFYGVENVTPSQIFTNINLRPAASAASLEQTLLLAE